MGVKPAALYAIANNANLAAPSEHIACAIVHVGRA